MEQLLLNKVMALRHAYYVLNESLVTDEQYDVLEKQALLIDPQDHPIRLPGSDLESDYTQTYRDIVSVLRQKDMEKEHRNIVLEDSSSLVGWGFFQENGEKVILKLNHEVLDPSLYEVDGQTITFKDNLRCNPKDKVIDRYFEVLLADSTKSKDGFTFLFKGETKEIPTQVFRFTAQSDIEAMSYLITDHVYLLTRLEDGSEVYRRPYDAWK